MFFGSLMISEYQYWCKKKKIKFGAHVHDNVIERHKRPAAHLTSYNTLNKTDIL